MTKPSPFLPIARPFAGRKTSTDLFGEPESPFPLLTRDQKAQIEWDRFRLATAGTTLELSGPVVLGVRLS